MKNKSRNFTRPFIVILYTGLIDDKAHDFPTGFINLIPNNSSNMFAVSP
jgi:hypothetical protein